MWKYLVLSVMASYFTTTGASVANAELLLTVNGLNPVNSPITINNTEQILIEVEGNSPAETNNVSITASEGILQTIDDVNQQYLFDFNDGTSAATVSLIVNTDVIIEEKAVLKGTAICELYLFIDSENNIINVIGLGINELIPPEEQEEIAQSELFVEEAAEQIEINIEESPIETEIQPTTYYNTLPPLAIKQEKQKIQKNFQNIMDFETFESRKQGSYSWSSNISELNIENDLTQQSIIEISSDITTNQIWTADNAYHIVNDVNVHALLVIEPGTMVIFAYEKGIFVENGGTLISAGTPDNPIIYTCDFMYPDWGYYYDVYLPTYGYYYYCPIYIKETASPATTVTYCFIEGAVVGIVTKNIKLDHPIENNYLCGNLYGIGEKGTRHTDIINNLCLYSYYTGIDVNLGDNNSVGDADSIINIRNNTCDVTGYTGYGIRIHGVINEEGMGEVILVNNIVSEAAYGIVLGDGWMSSTIANTGYYGNGSDRFGYEEWEEYNPVYETEWPYVDGEGILQFCHLLQDCAFVNASDQYIEQTRLIGRTTDINNSPDSNLIDLGFHHPNWDFSNPGNGDSLSADLDDDLMVDFNDFAVLANYWQQSTSTDADLDDSGFIDYADLDILAEQWLKNADPNIQIQISGDSNSGYVDVGITGWTMDTVKIFILLNGQIVGGTFRFKDDDSITIDISKYGNGVQKFKVVSVDSNSNITCSNITDVDFSRTLNYCVLPKTYEKNQPLPFSAYNSGAENIIAKVYANGGNLVWSQTFTENSINGSIPTEITNQYEFDYVSFDNESGQSLAKKITDPSLANTPSNVLALIVAPKWYFRLYDFQTLALIRFAFEAKGVPYVQLSGANATYNKVKQYATNNNVKYLYIGCTDGHFLINEKAADAPDNRRTNFDLYDPQGGDESYETIVSIQRDDYSDPNMAPSWCIDLWLRGLNSVATMGFDSLEFAYFDICYSGRLRINSNNQLVQCSPGQQGLLQIPYSDMSFALGLHEPSRSRFYQGWHDKSWSKILLPTTYQLWTQNEWSRLREGDDLYTAIMDTIMDPRQPNGDPNDPVNCYRLSGQGLMQDIILRNW